VSRPKNFPYNKRMKERGILLYERKRYSTPDQRLVDRRERKILRRILKGLGPFHRVLDIPSGYGRLYKILRETSSLYFGSDISIGMISRLREKSGGGREVVGDIFSLPFRDESFDLVLSWRIFQHIGDGEKRMRALSELSRVTRRWVLISFYRENLIHWLERVLTGRKSRISMVKKDDILSEAEGTGLIPRLMVPIFPLVHSQTLLLLEKKG
jgi:SAM-dependent methyltransferase